MEQVVRDETEGTPFWCPVNESSFTAGAGGDAQHMNPFAVGRAFELMIQLARGAIAAKHALREVDPLARFVHCMPLIDEGHPLHRPLSESLYQPYARDHRAMLIAKTGAEYGRRASWFSGVADEVARARGELVEGVCLYPVADHLGRDDDRLCPNRLLGDSVAGGARRVAPYLGDVVRRVVTRYSSPSA